MKLLSSLPRLPAIQGSCSSLAAHFLLSHCRLTSVPITLGTFFYQGQLTTLPWVFTLLSGSLYPSDTPYPPLYSPKKFLSFCNSACTLFVLFLSSRLLCGDIPEKQQKIQRVGMWHSTYTWGWDGREFRGVGGARSDVGVRRWRAATGRDGGQVPAFSDGACRLSGPWWWRPWQLVDSGSQMSATGRYLSSEPLLVYFPFAYPSIQSVVKVCFSDRLCARPSWVF